ncbi:MAG: threo-3-hydroxy-L-aspartate ammonia-lyase [Candidatus Meridianibacter frigidus]|nr:MAG: threo-3-hydroxy-L-aspartate ammonia-lyase [Candidatus Eremiobacteraeota bacterium]
MGRAREGERAGAVSVALQNVRFDDILAAARRLQGVAHRTPVLTSRTLDALTGARVYLKCENFQRMGAFKFRGAYNRLVQLDAAQREGGVVTYSSGNHAQGVALAARLLGVAATVVMPADAPESKLAASRGYDAEIVFYRRPEEDREQIARRIAHERRATLVPPYDDVQVIAGQATAALEFLQDKRGIDVLLVPTGGGGLLAGSAVTAAALDPQIAVYGVEPEAGNDFQQSFLAGRRVTIPVPDTIADGMMTQAPGELTFPIVRRLAHGITTVSDDELRVAMRFAFERMKLVIEPSGAAGLAALLAGKLDVPSKGVGVIISGGNVDAASFAEILQG